MKYHRVIQALTGVVAMTLLVGCGEEQPKKEDTYTKATWFCDVSFWNPPAWDTREGTITGDVTKKTGMAFDITVPKEDAATRLGIKIVNDELPDVITATNTKLIHRMIANDRVWDLEELLRQYVPDSHLLKEFPEDVKEVLVNRDGGWYVFPSHMESPDNQKIHPPCDEFYEEMIEYCTNDGIIWNEKLLKEAGLTMEDVKTQEQVLAAFEKVQKMNLEVDGKPVILCLTEGENSMRADQLGSALGIMMNSFGAGFTDEKNGYQLRVLSPEAKRALHFLNQLVRNNYLDMRYLTDKKEDVQKYIKERRVLCFIGNIADTGINSMGEAGLDWAANGPILSSDGKKPVYPQNIPKVNYWLNTLISKKCEDPEGIARWLDYMTSDEGRLLTQYGYEEETYILNDRGQVELTKQGGKDRDNYRYTGVGVWWAFVDNNWYFSKAAPPEENTPHRAQEILRMAFLKNENTKRIDYTDFSKMERLSENDSQLYSMETRLYDYLEEKTIMLLTCASDEEFEQAYQEMVEGMKAYDSEKIKEINNKYLNRARKKRK